MKSASLHVEYRSPLFSKQDLPLTEKKNERNIGSILIGDSLLISTACQQKMVSS